MTRVLLAAVALLAAPASAQEAFVGAYAHGVETPLTFETGEGGADIMAGYRFAPAQDLRAIGAPSFYVMASVNTQGDTSFAAVGLNWRVGVGGPVYARPGIGLAVHDGPSFRCCTADGRRTELGSRVLFVPEIALGADVSPRVSLEASWVHLSHARLFNAAQNPGLDMWGVRLVYRTR